MQRAKKIPPNNTPNTSKWSERPSVLYSLQVENMKGLNKGLYFCVAVNALKIVCIKIGLSVCTYFCISLLARDNTDFYTGRSTQI